MTEWQYIRSEGILGDEDRLKEYIASLLSEIQNVKRDRDQYKTENESLRLALKLQEKAAMQRLEAIKINTEAHILELQSKSILKGEVVRHENIGSYVSVVGANNTRETDDDDDIYSDVSTTSAWPATDDANALQQIAASDRVNGEVERGVEVEQVSVDNCRRPLPALPTPPTVKRRIKGWKLFKSSFKGGSKKGLFHQNSENLRDASRKSNGVSTL